MPAVINPNSLPPNSGGWFGGLGDIFSWGGGNDPPPMPSFQPPPPTTTPGPQGRMLPPPQISQMPPVPQGSGTSTAWGGPEVSTNPLSAPPVAAGINAEPTATGPKSYSFMDNPGASDAMVAFGAAMLKAPNFNQGLGDAALAVNQVAKSYRMPTEQDYARAKQLGMVQRIARGYDEFGNSSSGPDYGSKEMGYAPDPATGEMVPVPAFLDKNGGVKYQMPDGTITEVAPRGWQRATDTSVGADNKYNAKNDAEAASLAYTEAQAAYSFLGQISELRSVAPTAGIGLDKGTQIARRLTELTGMSFDNIDTSSISTMEAGVRQMALDWSFKMKGQGQVTESERDMIAKMMPQAAMDPDAFNRLVDLLERTQKRKIALADEWFANQKDYRQRYGSFRGFALARMKELEASDPLSQPPSGGSTSGGQRKSLNDIFQ